MVKQKYEVLTREYDAQNKVFNERHNEIRAAEAAKSDATVKNFEENLAQIRESISQDAKNNELENKI